MRNLPKKYLCVSLLISALQSFAAELADPLENLQLVGEGRLRVLFWRIYDSSFYSESGSYNGIEPGTALKIEYRRAIKVGEIINRTREEWEKMNILSDESEKWLAQLGEFLPSVVKGDVIVLKVDDTLGSIFYYNFEPIGQIRNPQFTKDFLSIWLSDKSSFPKLQRQLIGL